MEDWKAEFCNIESTTKFKCFWISMLRLDFKNGQVRPNRILERQFRADFVEQKASVFEQLLISNYLLAHIVLSETALSSNCSFTLRYFLPFSTAEHIHLHLFVRQACACL